MTDAVPSRLGQANASGDALALFLKVFPGEVLKTFYTANVTLNRHFVKTIASGD